MLYTSANVCFCSPESVGPDFTLEIEVYCSVPVEESSGKPSTPIKMLKKLRSRPQVQ